MSTQNYSSRYTLNLIKQHRKHPNSVGLVDNLTGKVYLTDVWWAWDLPTLYVNKYINPLPYSHEMAENYIINQLAIEYINDHPEHLL